jgi:hypothetical protein
MPRAECGGERPPFTAILGDIDDDVEKLVIINNDISVLFGEEGEYLFPLFWGLRSFLEYIIFFLV